MDQADPNLKNLLPPDIDGWITAGEDRSYNRDNLHDYINGGAELYLSYGFAEVFSRTYSRSGQPDIMVDVFDMGSSHNAFGVFCHSRETVDQTVGQGSQYTSGLLLFWKNNVYVSVIASPETNESKRAAYGLAERIAAAIPKEGPLPDILELLPRRALIEESIRYFHHYIWLNSFYFVADENILHIDETTDVVLAKYDTGERRSILLVAKYGNEEETAAGYADFAEHYLPELSDAPVAQIEDGTWTACRKSGRLLAIVFNSPMKEAALGLIEKVLDDASAK